MIEAVLRLVPGSADRPPMNWEAVRRKSPMAGLRPLLGSRACEIMRGAGEEKSGLRGVCICQGGGHLGIGVVLENFTCTI